MMDFEFPHGSWDEASISSLEKAWNQLFQLKGARFFELPARADLWRQSQMRAKEIQSVFEVSCVIGIGGSSLGGRALQRSFRGSAGHRVEFFEAPDETAARRWRTDLGSLKKAHFIFISKSGKTLETLALLDYWTKALKESGLELARQATVICGPTSSPLLQWARQNSVPVLPVPEDVGGRFSVLTPVGLLPAALMGVSLEGLRSGAAWALSQRETVLRLAAVSLRDFRDERWLTQLWVYSDAFSILGLWWQQLWSESLAKKKSRSGAAAPRVSTPMVCLGPQDQHSLLQQLQEGAPDKSVILFGITTRKRRATRSSPPISPAWTLRFRTCLLVRFSRRKSRGFRARCENPEFQIFRSWRRPLDLSRGALSL